MAAVGGRGSVSPVEQDGNRRRNTAEFRPITGPFIDGIAGDIPSNNWGRAEWAARFDLMKAMGMDTVSIIRVGWLESAMYPSAGMLCGRYPEYLRARGMMLDGKGPFARNAGTRRDFEAGQAAGLRS